MKKSLITLMVFSALNTFAAPMQMPPVAVKTQTVEYSSWQPTTKATGKLIAQQGIIVKSEVAGRITQLFFKSGDTVTAGAPLIQMNDQALQAQKKLLESDLALSQTDLQRKQDLYTKRAISKAELDAAMANVKSDQAKIEQVNAQLNQHLITAPFAGRLGLRQVSLGDFLSPGQAIVSLQTTDPIMIDFDIPTSMRSQIKVGQTIRLEAPAYPETQFTGKITALEALVSPGSQSLVVRAVVPNKDAKLLPGTFVGVNVTLKQAEQVIMIPQTAVIYSLKGTYVYTTDGKTVKKQPITLGARTKEAVLVKSGLQVGDIIVTVGNLKLYEGAKIMTAPGHNPQKP